jgi:hypothetical protein
MITGAGGSSVPATAFENSDGRAGLVGDAKTKSGSSDSSAVAPVGAATVQQTVNALNSLGIRVLSMGPGAAPTNDAGPSDGPSVWESAIARVTGALDSSGKPLVFSMSVSNADLTGAIANAVKATSTAPVEIGLKTTRLPAGMTFASAEGVSASVGPGGTATFHITLTVPSVPFSGTFDVHFVDVHSDAVLGVIPVSINVGASSTNPQDPAPEVISGRRLGFHKMATTLVLTFTASMDADSAQNLSNYILVGPRGNVIKFKSAAYDAKTKQVRLKPAERLKLRDTYLLKVKGAAPWGAIAGTDGVTLGATASGQSQQEYVAKVRWWMLKPLNAAAKSHVRLEKHKTVSSHR